MFANSHVLRVLRLLVRAFSDVEVNKGQGGALSALSTWQLHMAYYICPSDATLNLSMVQCNPQAISIRRCLFLTYQVCSTSTRAATSRRMAYASSSNTCSSSSSSYHGTQCTRRELITGMPMFLALSAAASMAAPVAAVASPLQDITRLVSSAVT